MSAARTTTKSVENVQKLLDQALAHQADLEAYNNRLHVQLNERKQHVADLQKAVDDSRKQRDAFGIELASVRADQLSLRARLSFAEGFIAALKGDVYPQAISMTKAEVGRGYSDELFNHIREEGLVR